MTYGFGFVIESLVAVLLMITIAYCVILNSRLMRLKADEQALKATIAELITATEIAERAVAGLKTTAHECDHTLGERLRTAERYCTNLDRQIKSGDLLLKRLSRIVAAAQPSEPGAEQASAAEHATAAEPEPQLGLDVELADVPALAAMPAAKPPSAPDPRAVAAATQAFADRARTRLNSLAA
jgi:hypothetical protein